ncbi:MAG: DinB family protein [Jatrophihabitans sp.]|uniref:DinB family protein n=1 Tax=Jatrophihabitans sp. TaxID=1932789 RepID=UPI003F7E670D
MPPSLLVGTGGERAVLEAFVDDQRLEVRALLDDLTETQARSRLVASRTTLLGLVKHCTFVERAWYTVYLGRRATRAELGMPTDSADSFLLDEADTIASVLAGFDAAVADSRAIVAGFDLDATVDHPHMGTLSLRWIHHHVIRELARHAGHGDILREQLLTPL